MAVKLQQLTPVTIATPGSAQQLSALGFACTALLLQADELNTGNVYVGDSDVDSTTGTEIPPGGTLPIEAGVVNGTTDELFPLDIWVDTDTGGNVVKIIAFRRRL